MRYLKENYKKILGAIIFICLILSLYYSYSITKQKEINERNSYQSSFSNLVNYINSAENYLAKAMISESSNHAAKTLTQVYKDTDLAIVYLSQIPNNVSDDDTVSNSLKFLNQLSNYSYTLSRKCIDGEELEEKDFENLEMFYNYCLDLEKSLNILSDEIDNNVVTLGNSNNMLKFAQEVDNFSVLTNVDENLNDYEGLIYDGAYSDHINKKEKVGLTGEDISKEEAEKIVNDFFKENYEVSSVDFNEFIENADIPSYDFSVGIKNNQNKYSIMVSKKGGHVVETSCERRVNEEKITLEDANSLGKEYLKSKGFESMEETYYIKQENILTINYAYSQNTVIIYPDLIKVKVALDNGEILGIETSGYLNAHKEREISAELISEEEAKEKINSKLEIIDTRLCIIPTEWKEEILCYEFKGKVKDKEFLVYINARTGKEENILIILETPGGILTT